MCLPAQRSFTSAVTGTVDLILRTQICSTKTYQRVWGQHALHGSKFFAVLGNKADLLSFLCNKWCEKEKLKSALGQTHFYLDGVWRRDKECGVYWRCPCIRIHTTGGWYKNNSPHPTLYTTVSRMTMLTELSMPMTQTSSATHLSTQGTIAEQ